MLQLNGQEDDIFIILHGGCGVQDKNDNKQATDALCKIAQKAMRLYKKNDGDILETATLCVHKMEENTLFNAGIGSALQSDGMARLSAALMDGKKQRFSGIICSNYINHPSTLAQALQKRRARVLTNPGTELLARELSLPIESHLTGKRSKSWLQALDKNDFDIYATDTVGCIIFGKKKHLTAAASTGGRGFEYPGRVSDTSTVAGTYASKHAAIAATGFGEEIVDDALAARIETRVRDGMPLHTACEKAMLEAAGKKRRYGWIALDNQGNWSICRTTKFMSFVVMGTKGLIASS